MGFFSIWNWAIYGAIGVALLSFFGARRNSTQTYVIKEWVANETPDHNGVYVQIKGRKGGLLAFLLTFVGVDPVVSLVVDHETVRFNEGSWNGFSSTVTPLEKLCTGQYGYHKPFWGSVILFFLGILLASETNYVSLVFSLWGLLNYFFNKTIKIGINYISGSNNGFAFKRSLIERQNIDENAAERIIAIIEMIMLGRDKPRAINVDVRTSTSGEMDAGEQARQKMEAMKAQALRAGGQAASKVASSLAAASEAGAQKASVCQKCNAAITVDDKFCGNCGTTIR